MDGIDRLAVVTEMLETPLDPGTTGKRADGQLLDTDNDPQFPATAPAYLDVG